MKLTARQKELLREFEAINEDDPGAHNPRAKSFMDKVRDFFGHAVDPPEQRRRLERCYDVVVIGAGAAGMMCAAQAGQRGRRVLLVEHYHKLGEKIRISGGGRCNFTNIGAGPAQLPVAESGFLPLRARAVHGSRFRRAGRAARDRVPREEAGPALLRPHGAGHHRDAQGRMRPRPRRVAHAVRGRRAVERADGAFVVATAEGPVRATSLVIATGGLTVPKIGATPFGYKIAEQFGLSVVPPRPALVPLALAPEWLARYGDLAGVALDVEVSCNGGRFRENLLFTHRGLSGPAILQISSYWDGKAPLAIDLLPGADGRGVVPRISALRRRTIDNVLAQRLPRRFVEDVVRGARRWPRADESARRSRASRRSNRRCTRWTCSAGRHARHTTRPR